MKHRSFLAAMAGIAFLPLAARAVFPRFRSPEAAPGARTYTVQAGDTLYRIAERLYGSGHRYRLIGSANPELQKNKTIRLGQILAIPPKP